MTETINPAEAVTPGSKARSTQAADTAREFYARFGTTAAEVRAWAQENGIEVGVRGRLEVGVLSAYGSAHGELHD